MSWIQTISYKEATGKLKQLYNRVKGPGDKVDNVLKIHSLRPHTLKGHMELYKSVLHHSGNSFAKWYLEALGTYVSKLNSCEYCVAHHAEGLRKNLRDDIRFTEIFLAIEEGVMPEMKFENLNAGMKYAKMLTLDHACITEQTIKDLRSEGLDDGEILEINQVVSYFNYVNRMVVGLGVNTEGDIIGLSPNRIDDEDNWSHG
jgi:uncharacterized peroxidase-related enzyme